jgi:molybdopterin/thiamine biosynthesis adenylyltransferase
MMAGEAVKEIAGTGGNLRNRLLIWDGLFADVRLVVTKSRHNCPVCGQ